jgi:diguanylate cyclase (GGDEF)-like protein
MKARPDQPGLPRTLAAFAIVGALAAVGVLDYRTGPWLSLSILYVMLVLAAAWWLGRGPALLAGLTAGVAWFEAEAFGRRGEPRLDLMWNAGTRLIMLVAMAAMVVRIRTDRRRLSQVNARLGELLSGAEHLARTDALTGLPNRRAADETLKRLAAHAGRQVSPLSVVMLDLDHFKQINDIHGHDQGDRALAAVGETLRSTLRASDFAARYGGEEFIVLLPDTDRDAARDVAEKLRLAIQETEVTHVGPLSASFGVAVMPADATEIEQLIRKADRALYSAKADGRNRVKTAPAFGAPASDAAEAKAAR